jgi:hypothetical protein
MNSSWCWSFLRKIVNAGFKGKSAMLKKAIITLNLSDQINQWIWKILSPSYPIVLLATKRPWQRFTDILPQRCLGFVCGMPKIRPRPKTICRRVLSRYLPI